MTFKRKTICCQCRFFCLIITSIFLGSCASLCEASLNQKKLSLTRHNAATVLGEPLTEFFQKRTARVYILNSNLQTVRWENGKIHLTFNAPLVQGESVSQFLAVPLSLPGYFLTSAHGFLDNTEHDKIWIVSRSNSDRYYGRAKVAWLSPKADLALLYSNVRPKATIKISNLPPPVNSIVYLGGLRGGDSAGVVLSVTKQDNEFFLVKHTAPFVRGDSGGPLVNKHGCLVGINCFWVTTYTLFWPQYSCAAFFKKAWLHRKIEDLARK